MEFKSKSCLKHFIARKVIFYGLPLALLLPHTLSTFEISPPPPFRTASFSSPSPPAVIFPRRRRGKGEGEERGEKKGTLSPPRVSVATGREKRGGEKREIVFLAFSSFSSPSPPPNYPCAVASQVPPMLPLCSVHRNTVFPPPKKKKEGGRNNKTDRPREAIIILLHR